MGKCGYYLMFHPWIYVTIVNVVLDVVASGYFIWDLINSMVNLISSGNQLGLMKLSILVLVAIFTSFGS